MSNNFVTTDTTIVGFGVFRGPYKLLSIHTTEQEAWKEAAFTVVGDNDQKELLLEQLHKRTMGCLRCAHLIQAGNYLPTKLWLQHVVYILHDQPWALCKGLTVHPINARVVSAPVLNG